MTLFETIRIENKQLYHINAHNTRLNASRYALFGQTQGIDLAEHITLPNNLSNDLYRCRVDYDETGILTVQFFEYTPKNIQRVGFCELPAAFDYRHKYAERTVLNAALLANADVDEVIFVQNGFVTDSTIANLVFDDGKQLYTPATPLLQGTQRNALLQSGTIHTQYIRPADLDMFKRIAFINAMRKLALQPYTIKSSVEGFTTLLFIV